MNIVLINPYEIGRQPFGLAEPAAWLKREGFHVDCLDLSIQKLDPGMLANAGMVAVYLPMHTATRIAAEAIPKIREMAPTAHLCVFGLYAPMNADLFTSLGVKSILGGETEPAMRDIARRLEHGDGDVPAAAVTQLDKIGFITPDRSVLPPLEHYAQLVMPNGEQKTVGFAETTRGCKYRCRHCPVVPVYNGTFRVIPEAVVMDDIRAQVEAGARHISFGDPDFFNGPGHALRVVHALNEAFPGMTYDATIKIEHLVKYTDQVRELASTGCLFIVSAVESVDDTILDRLDKGHTRQDFVDALALLRDAGIAMSPTFVAFTPWTTLEGYLELLRHVLELGLIEAVAPVQLGIRLLIPRGSLVLDIEGIDNCLDGFDESSLGYRWHNPSPAVDDLQQTVMAEVMQGEKAGRSRREIFFAVWQLAHRAAGTEPPLLDDVDTGEAIPRLSENWYCCAEPTDEQLTSI